MRSGHPTFAPQLPDLREMDMVRNILLCTDGSEQALNAVDVAADMAVRHDPPSVRYSAR